MRPTLVVFAKAPVIGGPKRRLAADLGDVAAWRIYRAMTAQVIRRTADPRWLSVLAADPDEAAGGCFPGVWPEGLARIGQGGGDLGDRLTRALSLARPTVVIGTDAPDVAAGDVAAAFDALRRRAAHVLGPALDGGFWLIGSRRPPPRGALRAVRWSTRHALVDATKALGVYGEVALLRRLADVDAGADWRARQGASK